jgi:aminopeptidase N
MKYTLLLPLTLIAGAAQARHHHIAKDTTEHVVLKELSVTSKVKKPPYQATAPQTWKIANTRVALGFDWNARTADAKEWIKASPYFYATDSIVLDAKGMRIDTVALITATGNRNLQYVYANDRLAIKLDRIYTAAEGIELFFKYTAMPYGQATGGSAAITDDRGLYFINTDRKIPNKPAQIWTQGETESNSHWMITFDKPNTRFTTQIELTVPDEMVTLSNGALIKQVKAANGLRTDIWKMDLPIQAYAAMFAIGKFSIVKEKWNNREVNYYVEPEYERYARLMFNNTPEMMAYFSEITGVSYPWNKYSQVVVRDYVSGAMENTSASLFGEFMNQDAREIADKNSEDVVSHELFHQWFGDYVTAESWSNLTVNESFANYGEQLWRRHKYGKDEGDMLAWTDLQNYLATSAFKDPQLVRFNYDSREEVFDAISYNKGGSILHYLQTLIGDEAFYKAMNIYLSKNALRPAEAHNWRMAVEEATGQDWTGFFNQWYYHAGHPSINLTYTYDDSAKVLTVTANLTQNDSTLNYFLPLKAALVYGNEKTITDWTISKRSETFTYAYKNGIAPIFVPDYQHILPGEIRESKKPAQWLQQYLACSDDMILRRLAIAGACKQIPDSSTQALTGIALKDPSKFTRRYMLDQMDQMKSDRYHKKWGSWVIEMAGHDGSNSVRAEALQLAGEWKLNNARETMIAALQDSSYQVAGAALTALNKIDKDTAYAAARRMLNDRPKASLDGAIWSIVGQNGKDEDAALYEQAAPFISGTKKFQFAGSMGNYMKHVKGGEAFSRVLTVYNNMIQNEEMKSYASSLTGMLIQAGSNQLSNTKSDNKEEAATAEQRLTQIKTILIQRIAEVTDKDDREELNQMMKDTFEQPAEDTAAPAPAEDDKPQGKHKKKKKRRKHDDQ